MLRRWKLFAFVLLAGSLAACGGSQTVSSPDDPSLESPPESTVVARYAESAITLAELDSAFAASVGGRENAADSSLAAYRTFLDQYVNFRLKVRAARDAGMDTLSSVKRDVNSYLRKRARPQFMREKVFEPVVRNLYERRKHEVDVSHILVRVTDDQDSLAARRTLETLVDSLDQGIPFSALAYRHSDDPSAQQEGRRGYQGRLGYIQAGQVVEPFEDRMYRLNPGDVSDIFRTQYGYHVLKVHDRREVDPPVQLSHIMRQPAGDSARTRRFLDSLRTEIASGETTFSAAAEQHSQDEQSAVRGGDLGSVQPQALPGPFQQALADLDSVGAVSDVVRTRFGYHLLKLTGREEQQSFEEAYADLKEQVSGQPRVEEQKRALAQEVWTNVGASVDTTRLLSAAGISSADSVARPLLSQTENAPNPSPAVASLGDSTFTVRQFAQHLTQTDGGAQMTVAELIDSFLNEKALEYAVIRSARNDSALSSEIKNYREGVLLFRYMQDSVWTAAAEDTEGLRQTFEQNRDEYRFPQRVRTVAFRAPADSLLHPHLDTYENTQSLAETVQSASDDSLVAVDTVFVTDRSAEVYQSVQSIEDEETVGPMARQTERLFLIRDAQLPPRRKTFEEARSSVIQDYQDIYENRVLRQLRDRYQVETYPERLRRPFQKSEPSE